MMQRGKQKSTKRGIEKYYFSRSPNMGGFKQTFFPALQQPKFYPLQQVRQPEYKCWRNIYTPGLTL